eukprot:15367190-Ditylum_brightwellii.AAC.3
MSALELLHRKSKSRKKKGGGQTMHGPDIQWSWVNIIGWSRSCSVKSPPSDALVLSSYMLSPSYCGYLRKKVQHRTTIAGQLKRMIANCIWLLMMTKAVQRSKIQHTFTKVQAMGKAFSTPPHMGSPSTKRSADRAELSCQNNNIENWEVVTPYHT